MSWSIHEILSGDVNAHELPSGAIFVASRDAIPGNPTSFIWLRTDSGARFIEARRAVLPEHSAIGGVTRFGNEDERAFRMVTLFWRS